MALVFRVYPIVVMMITIVVMLITIVVMLITLLGCASQPNASWAGLFKARAFAFPARILGFDRLRREAARLGGVCMVTVRA